MVKSRLAWHRCVRIIRSRFSTIDLFEDIADPRDWPLLISAEQKTNPRLAETIGMIDLVPADRRVGGPGSSYLMAPFTHVSMERPSRFSDGSYGVLYAGKVFETALLETVYHHARFMAATREPMGLDCQFREIILDVDAVVDDLRDGDAGQGVLDQEDYRAGQELGARLRASGSNGVVYPSVRHSGGECIGLFYPDCASSAVQGRHLEHHWDGARVDFFRDMSTRKIFRLV